MPIRQSYINLEHLGHPDRHPTLQNIRNESLLHTLSQAKGGHMIWAVWEPCNPLLRVHIDDDTMICDIWVDVLHVSVFNCVSTCLDIARTSTVSVYVHIHICRSLEATCHWICCGHWSRHPGIFGSYASKMAKKGSTTATGLLSKELRDKNICLDSRAGISSLILGLEDTCVFILYTHTYAHLHLHTHMRTHIHIHAYTYYT